MKRTTRTLIAIFFLLFIVNTFAQEWTSPVEVSNTEGAHMSPDICIDNNGVIHIVWSRYISYKFRKIMYSYSVDNGETWSDDYDISQNDTLWMSQPHIDVNTDNNLFVTYDYDTYSPSKMLVYLQIYDGLQWSAPILVTEDMPGSDYNKLIVTDDDKVFVFWATGGIYSYYRIYNNGIWSEILEPYFNYQSDLYYIYTPVLDTNNEIHFSGYTTESMMPGEYAQAYFLYNIVNNSWNTPVNITLNPALIGNDICLNNEYNPSLAIREETSSNQSYDATFYITNDGQQWSQPELVVEDPQDQQIAVDQFNNTHIINREKTGTGFQLVHYQMVNNEWVGCLIDSGYIVQRPILKFNNNQLLVTYDKTWEVGNDFIVEIMFTKYDITTNCSEHIFNIGDMNVFPNPTSGNISISFKLNRTNSVKIIISDFNGKLIKNLFSGRLDKGVHNVAWNGTNKAGEYVANGLYLCRLYAGKNVISKSIVITK